MKLRIQRDFVQLRLARGEVDVFARDGRVEDAARFGADGVVMTVPAAVAARWTATTGWASRASRTRATAPCCASLVEKDLTHLKTRSGEDRSDAFPNPHDHC